jgi:hypothetical protein
VRTLSPTTTCFLIEGIKRPRGGFDVGNFVQSFPPAPNGLAGVCAALGGRSFLTTLSNPLMLALAARSWAGHASASSPARVKEPGQARPFVDPSTPGAPCHLQQLLILQPHHHILICPYPRPLPLPLTPPPHSTDATPKQLPTRLKTLGIPLFRQLSSMLFKGHFKRPTLP